MKKSPGLLAALTAWAAVFAPMASLYAADWFVTTNGSGDGSSWSSPTNSIQGAINAATSGVTVWVSNGVYETGGVTNFPTGTLLTNRVAIWKAITVRSANNDPTNTIIKGAGPNGSAAVRCVWMTNGASLIGFMLTNGATLASGAFDERGGGVSCQSIATISNCVMTGNSAGVYGGGAIYGTLYNCTLTGNSASGGTAYGGGAYGGTLYNCTLSYNSSAYRGGGTAYGTRYNCTLSYNSSTYYGGGAYGGTLYNCTLTGNSVPYVNTRYGGGAYLATLYNCTLTSNSAFYGCGAAEATMFNCTLIRNVAGYAGGGTYAGTLYNCILTGNEATYGAGMYGSTLYNCTVTGNSAARGGGAETGTLINSIVYFNSATGNGSNHWVVVAFTNTCTAPAGAGPGNITDNPTFIDKGSGFGTNHVAGNYRLRNTSPALNAGTNFAWMTDTADARSKDFDGQRRIDNFSRQVDMGCYENMPSGTMFTGH